MEGRGVQSHCPSEKKVMKEEVKEATLSDRDAKIDQQGEYN